MSVPASDIREWSKDNRYLISTDASLIPHDVLNDEIFDADDFAWGKPLSENALQTLIDKSMCFGIYELNTQASASAHIESPPPQRKLIGFARLITDFVTVNYLTDVYILPQYRLLGLGVWLMQCIDQVFRAMPDVRGMILIADRGSKNEAFYRKHLDMGELADLGFCMDRKGNGAV